MPRAPKYCAARDCLTLVPAGVRACRDHESRWPTDSRNQRTDTAEHKAWAEAVLVRAGYRCQIRYTGLCTGDATDADHIRPVAEGGPEFDPANGQAACPECHQAKSSDEGHRAQGHTVKVRDVSY